ncbi:hypothetical protein HOD05_03640 [Candidatus Woesearchaeota archaeon]|jgi:hypothetical protein|nr:hypothetical protein [Candidatus Woesearchaeota archaeon]MBT4150645.1 hypothetical protein [Candidatus Woesearchaeota archaeon]MBT4247863.1 hypothetical protein [Candidatus Woesearchaeota archaeon]MBT4434287.1 hypothetical protein [Candidatus Woesearchaeota archaeon]MBT7331884.1 hypothetical protein [Candidatus Woesearchaeota archaeon]
MPKLTDVQRSYIQERGFEVMEGFPGNDFPYVVLGRLSPVNGDFAYCTSLSTSMSHVLGRINPDTREFSNLVNLIEEAVGTSMPLDGSCIFTTEPERKFPIYVVDDKWNQVAEALVARYQ